MPKPAAKTKRQNLTFITSYDIKPSMSERIGYARISSRDQNLDSQRDMLVAAGCTKIFEDIASGAKTARPGWDDLMSYVRPGDTVVVVELSRMTRSLAHLLQLVREFVDRKLGIVSLRENLDTTTATGRAFILMMGVINQLELELRAERTESGRAAAKARGRTGGRPRKDAALLEKAAVLYESSEYSSADVCKTVGVSPRTLFRYMAERKKPRQANGVDSPASAATPAEVQTRPSPSKKKSSPKPTSQKKDQVSEPRKKKGKRSLRREFAG